jgi:hypothetical protein
MNRFFSMLVVGAVVAVGVGASALAASAPDPVIGTWTLNVAKSKFSPGPAPTSATRTYAQTADGSIALTFSGVAADGSPTSGASTFKYDGKDYPITGSADYDTLSLKRVNRTTVKSFLKKDGKVIGFTTRTITAHGKVLTLSSSGKDAKGARFHQIAVYDKQ